MSIFGSFAIGVLGAVIGCLVGIALGSLCVEWYHISSFEGGSGYFVAMFALLGIVAGFICGVVVSRFVASTADPSALRAIGIAVGILVGIGVVAAGSARLFADIPPSVGGQPLLLLVEVRWPQAQTNSPAGDTTPSRLRLDVLSGNTVRKSKTGPVWLDKLREEDGRWIAPAAVELFTNRGTRVIGLEPGGPGMNGLRLPMNGTPSNKDFEWSEWMPRARKGAKPLPDMFTYRFRVIKRNQPARTDTVGPFEIETIVSAFYDMRGMARNDYMSAYARFVVKYKGKPVELRLLDAASKSGDSQAAPDDEAQGVRSVATLPGSPPALIVAVDGPHSQHEAQLLTETDGAVATTFIANTGGPLRAAPLTNDSKSREAAIEIDAIDGQIDTRTFANPGVYQFSEALFDTRTRSIRRYAGMQIPSLNVSVTPFGVSPDGRSFVQLGYDDSNGFAPALVVIDAEARKSYHVIVDVPGTRYSEYGAVNPEWLAHYYEWKPGENGHDHLVARKGVKPLPFKGYVNTESIGTRNYRVTPAGDAMVQAIAEFLTTEFNAHQTEEDKTQHSYRTHIGAEQVTIFNNTGESQIVVMLDTVGDKTLIPRIAERFDAALATGKYDSLYTYENFKHR